MLWNWKTIIPLCRAALDQHMGYWDSSLDNPVPDRCGQVKQQIKETTIMKGLTEMTSDEKCQSSEPGNVITRVRKSRQPSTSA